MQFEWDPEKAARNEAVCWQFPTWTGTGHRESLVLD
jgi:hypothetical protein